LPSGTLQDTRKRRSIDGAAGVARAHGSVTGTLGGAQEARGGIT